jgi:hypothetical protein
LIAPRNPIGETVSFRQPLVSTISVALAWGAAEASYTELRRPAARKPLKLLGPTRKAMLRLTCSGR